MAELNVLMLIRDPVKQFQSFQKGYWKASEYLIAQGFPERGIIASFLDKRTLYWLERFLSHALMRDWVGEYLVSLVQSFIRAFSSSSSSSLHAVLAWQGPGYVYALAKRLSFGSPLPKIYIINYYNCSAKNLKTRVIRYLLRHVLSLRSVTLICVVPSQARTFMDDFRLPNNRVRFLPLGVDTDFFCPSGKREDSPEPFIFCPGDFDRDDHLLFRACAGLPVKIVRTTKEPGYAKKIRRIASRNKMMDKVMVHAGIEAEVLRAYYRDSLFVVLPVINDAHPAGLTSLLESMACGKATIITEGLTTEYYTEHMMNAVYCRQGDGIDLREKIQFLMENAVKRKEIGANARHRCRSQFPIRNFANRICDIMSE